MSFISFFSLLYIVIEDLFFWKSNATTYFSELFDRLEFGLKFENIKNEEQIETTTEAEMVTIENNDKKDAEIVSLDSFRK